MGEPVMYIIANKSLGMSLGKLAAQVSHAAVKAYLLSELKIREEWDSGSYAKIILGAKDEAELKNIGDNLYAANLNVWLVRDEGRTEIEPGSITALAVEIVDKEKYKYIFSKYSLFS